MTCDLINGIPLYSSYKLWHLHEALRILEVSKLLVMLNLFIYSLTY